MARLFLTDKEKKQSFMQMDDKALGRYCKEIMLQIKDGEEETQKWKMVATAAAAMLIDMAIQVNATTSEYEFEGFSLSGKKHGDWIVTAKKK
jgi:hypothetical protein